MSNNFDYNKRYVQIAQVLRKHMTPEEQKIWYQFLLFLPMTAHRQRNIGNYILDFYIAEKKIAVEIDGQQHNRPIHKEKDAERDQYLNDLGITVLRYSNVMVNDNFRWVCKDILVHLDLDPDSTFNEINKRFLEKIRNKKRKKYLKTEVENG